MYHLCGAPAGKTRAFGPTSLQLSTRKAKTPSARSLERAICSDASLQIVHELAVLLRESGASWPACLFPLFSNQKIPPETIDFVKSRPRATSRALPLFRATNKRRSRLKQAVNAVLVANRINCDPSSDLIAATWRPEVP